MIQLFAATKCHVTDDDSQRWWCSLMVNEDGGWWGWVLMMRSHDDEWCWRYLQVDDELFIRRTRTEHFFLLLHLSEALIKRLKSLLQCRRSVRVYKMADGADGKSQMYVLFCYFEYTSINGLHHCLRLLCRLLHRCKPLSKYVARPWSANLHLTQPS